MQIKNKYIIGTHIMFYEIDMAEEHIQSIINAVNRVANPENVIVDLLFNISEYFEKVDTSKITKLELKQKFINLIEMLRSNDINVRYNIYENDDEPLTMVDYRRDLNYKNCKSNDYVIWGETDCLLPREMFQALEQIKSYANQQNIHRFITTFAIRKMWDDNWKPLEHPDFTNETYYEDERAFDYPHSIRYTMSIDEMNEVNNKADSFDLRILNKPQFDGSCLILSSDLIKSGVNIPHGIIGLIAEPQRLAEIRKNRMNSFKETGNQKYTNLQKIQDEVNNSKNTFQKFKWPTIDVSRKSVEETAASVIKIYEISRKNA